MTTGEFIEKMIAFRKSWAIKHEVVAYSGIPETWFAAPNYRCVNGHVSTHVRENTSLCNSICSRCNSIAMITFPDDQDGPFPEIH